jgi:hypothetical protein
MYTEGGKWKLGGETWTNWCEGFLPGMMWIFYSRTGDAALAYNDAEHIPGDWSIGSMTGMCMIWVSYSGPLINAGMT